MDHIFTLICSEIIREIRIAADSTFIKLVVLVSLFMWTWRQVDKLMKLR